MVKSKKMMKDIMLNPPKDLSEAYDRAEGFIAIEEAIGSLKSHSQSSDRLKDRDKNNNPRSDSQSKRNFNNGGSRGRSFNNEGLGGGRPPFRNRDANKVYTPLDTNRVKILEEVKDKPLFEPCPNNARPWRGNRDRYCDYHQTSGHSIEDYRNLKNLIEKNVHSEELVQYVASWEGSGKKQDDVSRQQLKDRQTEQNPPSHPRM